MNRAQALILVDDPHLVSSGLWPDRHAAQTPLWERAENVQFAGGKILRRIPNSFVVQDPDNFPNDPIRGIGQLQAADGVRWIYFIASVNVYRWYGPAPEFLYSAPHWTENATVNTMPTYWDFVPWGDWMLFNEAENGLFRKSDGGTGPLPNAPQDAIAILKKRNQLAAIGYGPGHRYVGFSDADDIENWNFADPTTLAVELPLEELNTPVRAACHFGPSIAVFGENQMFEVKWIGSPFYYGQQKLLEGIGAVGKMAVCSDARMVYGFGRNGVWKTDGLQFSYIDEVVLRDYIQQNVNWAQAAKAVVRKNDVTGCIEVSFPIGTSLFNNDAWAYDPRYGGWSQVPPFEVMDNRILFAKPLQGTEGGKVELMFDNTAIAGPLFLETKAMLVQRDNQMLHIGALVDELELFIHDVDKVQVQYGVAEYPDGPWTWTDPEEVVAKQVTYKLKSQISGVYHKLRFTSYEIDWKLDLQGFALFGELDGYKRDKS